MKAQSAVEFLSVYGLALLGIAIAAVLLYLFLSIPSSSVPSLCSFSGFLDCKNVVIGSNALAARAIFLLSNLQQYAIENATATINVTGTGAYSGGCNPNFILPGGILECTINFNKKITQNQLSAGVVYLSATVCSQPTRTGCATPIRQTYGGTFSAHISQLIPPPGCSISLSVQNSTQLANGAGDSVTANVKILGIDIAGATVNFTSDKTTVSLSQQFSNTDSNGNATSIASSHTEGNSLIIGSYSNCTASNTINFVTPIYVTFADNIPNTGYNVASIDGSWYTSLPRTIATIPKAVRSYAYNSIVPSSASTQYVYNSISGCGASAQDGSVSSATNCTVTGNYTTQYYLAVSATVGGSASATGGWYNSGNTVTISETPNIGYTFTGWTCTGAGCYSGTSASQAITMDNGKNETANFAINTYPFTESASPSGGGTVSPGSGTYNYGSSISISASANSGYIFTGWTCTGAGCYSGSSPTATVSSVTSAVTETANFQATGYWVYAGACGGLGGSSWCANPWVVVCPTNNCGTSAYTPSLSVSTTVYTPGGGTYFYISGLSIIAVNVSTGDQTVVTSMSGGGGQYIWSLAVTPNGQTLYALEQSGYCGSASSIIAGFSIPSYTSVYDGVWAPGYTHWGPPDNGGSVCDANGASGAGIGISPST